MAEKEKITLQGKADREAELEQLIHIEKPRAEEELNLARSQGDLSENSDYDAARAKLEDINRRIADIKYSLDHAEIIDSSLIDSSVVSVGGGAVTIRRIDNGQEYTISIVGASEANPMNRKISNVSPVAVAIIDHKVGDVCVVHAKIDYEVEIISID